ncbi:MAG: Fis family transcriptional regulator [Proteobacteria bacterium]|nr:MAG: Fis family transcriptional regulator [Pseudomonadota bacterium]PIE17356.1 MAG: Fis family transcriptional regulator [Pseudomonadota bacterium]
MPAATILVIDDEKNIRRTLRMVLESEDYDVLDASSAEEGLAILDDQVGCVLLDLKLPGISGMEALAKLQTDENSGQTEVPVIVISGHGTVADAVQATRLGAFDFLEKPLDRDRVVITVRNALRQQSMEREVGRLRQQVAGRFEMIGSSPVMQKLFAEISKVAPTRGRVLISGESGAGKELVARAIHDNSQLASGPFVKVNCAAIPPELIESELFGHEKGAFTGATARKRGLFEVADNGTIFLDEVGDMSLSAQAKVLRALQTGELTRVGGEGVIKVDVRVIAATNKDLQKEVEQGGFREDLFFRLNVIPLRAPPLRDRLDDVPEMVDHFVRDFCKENGFRDKTVDPEVLAALQRYEWPGNVRELKNIIERVVIMSDEVIRLADLPDYLKESQKPLVDLQRYGDRTLKEFKEQMEREFILMRLEAHDWNVSRTATALGIERTNLHKKLKTYNISKP